MSRTADGVRPSTLVAVSVGGAIGAVARYSVDLAVPAASAGVGAFPWSTLAVNVVGSFLVGVAMVVLGDRGVARPFVVTGFLGGFTTFSAYAAATQGAAVDGEPLVALLNLALTPLIAVLAAALGLASARRLAGGS